MYTKEVAKKVGIHPNTVRLYEAWGYISAVPRQANGYRLFDERHLTQLKIVRLAFQQEFIQHQLRHYATNIVKLSGATQFKKAIKAATQYRTFLKSELTYTMAAIDIASELLAMRPQSAETYTHQQIAVKLQLTEETIRNWERNGLFSVARNAQNRRCYTALDVQKLYVIRTLRSAHFSIASIRHLFEARAAGEMDIQAMLQIPAFQQEFYHATDALTDNLNKAITDVNAIIALLKTL